MSKNETLGQRLQRLRQEAGLTQEQLAAKSGLSVHNVRNWEHDHRMPGVVAVYRLAQALGVAMEVFGEVAAEAESTTTRTKGTTKLPRSN